MPFNIHAIVTPLKSFAIKSKKKSEAKLRKIRWRIYQMICSKKRRLKKTFEYYQKQVDVFLSEFSFILQPKVILIWTEKVTKTSADVFSFLSKPKNVDKIDVKAQSCYECSDKLDSVLLMLSTVLHWVRKQQDAAMVISEHSDTVEDEAKLGRDKEAPTRHDVKKIAKVAAVTKEIIDATTVCDKNVIDDGVAGALSALNNEKTSDGCYAISRDEQFRRSAMAFYKQPRK